MLLELFLIFGILGFIVGTFYNMEIVFGFLLSIVFLGISGIYILFCFYLASEIRTFYKNLMDIIKGKRK
jgi:hypothetical protein